MKIYLAGPLFTYPEKQFNSDLRDELVKYGYEILLPQEFCKHGSTSKTIFNECCDKLDHSDIVIANLDGADVDSGTAWEIGRSMDKRPIIGLRSDFRTHCNNNDYDSNQVNSMIEESCNHFVYVDNFKYLDELAAYLHQVIKEYENVG